MRWTSASLILVLFGLTSCQPPAQEESTMMESETSEMAEPAPLSAEDVAAVNALTQAWAEAARANDWAALAALYTQDAVLMPPNHEAVRGRSAIQEFFGTFPPVSDLQLNGTEVDGVGDVAFVTGSYSLTLAPEGVEPIQDSGKFLDIRRKQADGSWLFHLDQYNSDLPLPQ